MAQVLVTESYLDDIADAIRDKTGSEDTYTPAQMAEAIEDIHTADEVVLVSKSISANGTYNPASDSADGYSGVTVNVPNTYTAADEGKVVSSGALVAQESQNVSQNGTYDTTLKNQVVVAVPNSYSASDEGKVVSSGELVAQTSRNVTQNGTYDTTENNEVVVNVSGGGGTLIQKTITQNGTYNPADDNADGYSQVVVDVAGGSSNNGLLFHFDGNYKNSGSVDAVFNDITGLEISSEQSKFGGTSLKTGTTQNRKNCILLPGFELGTDDFTLDFWCYPISIASSGSTTQVPVAFAYRSLAVYINQSSINLAVASGSSWKIDNITNVQIAINQWHHIAVVRAETIVYLFLDGVKLQSNNYGDDIIPVDASITIGSNTYTNGDRRFEGYIDELRLKIGEAVWTDDFTPPTQPYT